MNYTTTGATVDNRYFPIEITNALIEEGINTK